MTQAFIILSCYLCLLLSKQDLIKDFKNANNDIKSDKLRIILMTKRTGIWLPWANYTNGKISLSDSFLSKFWTTCLSATMTNQFISNIILIGGGYLPSFVLNIDLQNSQNRPNAVAIAYTLDFSATNGQHSSMLRRSHHLTA